MYIGTSVTSPNGKISVAVVVDGQEQPLYRRLLDGKVFVAGEPGNAYTLRVINRLVGQRIEVINTVDGRNTLKDEPGDKRANSGLVFGSNSTGQFAGWRIDDDTTRDFVFGTPEDSIASQATGTVSNCGVIGFAVYTEALRVHRMPTFDQFSDNLLNSSFKYSGGAISGSRDYYADLDSSEASRLGTGMGAEREDRVGHTSFTRESSLSPDILVIGYDTAEVLTRKGIIAPPEPDAFPGVKTGYDKYQTTVQ